MDSHFPEHEEERPFLSRRIRARFLVVLGIAIVAAVLVSWIGGAAWDRSWIRVQLSFNGTLLRYRARPLADLRGIRLPGSDLRQASFLGASLVYADLSRVNAEGATFTDADMASANLSGGDFRKADLRGAILRNADLRNADLRGANLQGADLHGARLNGCKLADDAPARDSAGGGEGVLQVNLLGTDFTGAAEIPWDEVLKAKDWDLAIYTTEQVGILFAKSEKNPSLFKPPHFETWQDMFNRFRPESFVTPPPASSTAREDEKKAVPATHREGEKQSIPPKE